MSKALARDSPHFDLAAHCQRLPAEFAVVKYGAEWCNPCRQLQPAYDQLARQVSDVAFFTVDVDECEKLAAAQHVKSLPTIAFYRRGQEVPQLRIVGADIRAITRNVQWCVEQTASVPPATTTPAEKTASSLDDDKLYDIVEELYSIDGMVEKLQDDLNKLRSSIGALCSQIDAGLGIE